MTKNLSLGIDVGGTKIAAVVYNNKTHKVLSRADAQYTMKPPTMKEFTRVLWHVADTVMGQVFDGGVSLEHFKGIGIGSGGVIAPDRIYASKILGVLNRFPLRKAVEERYNLPTFIVGDVQAAILAAWKLGPYKDAKSFLMVMVSTGANAAYLKDGKVQTGAFDGGWSAWKMTFDAEKVKRGERGDLESLASEVFFRSHGGLAPLDVAKAAQSGDRKAILLWQEYGQNLGIVIANFINLLGPEVIVVGGGLSKSWKLFEKTMKETIQQNVFSPTARKRTKVVRTTLGTEAGVVGAALLPHTYG